MTLPAPSPDRCFNILLVDDDQGLTRLLNEYLSHQGCNISTVNDAEAAIHLLENRQSGDAEAVIDLIVLDIMMPGLSGLDLLPMIRARWNTPVIMLTGLSEAYDRVLGLETGADDYIGKPCNPRELLARIRAVLRRGELAVQEQASLDAPAELTAGVVKLHMGKREATVAGQAIQLTTAELNVLAELLKQAGKPVSREHLSRTVLHRELSPYDRSIDVHVSRVRQALRHKSDQDLILTVRGQGYQFSA